MNRKGLPRAQIFLIELILMILFFAIASAILLQVFSRASELSRDASTLNAAVVAAESAMDQTLSIPPAELGDSPQAYYYDSSWLPASETDSVYLVQADWSVQPEAGQLVEFVVTIRAVHSTGTDEALYTLKTKKYYPAEGGAA